MLHARWIERTAFILAIKQPFARFGLAPVDPQQLQVSLGKQRVPILAPFCLPNPQHHPLRIDIRLNQTDSFTQS